MPMLPALTQTTMAKRTMTKDERKITDTKLPPLPPPADIKVLLAP